MKKLTLPQSVYNWTSFIGTTIAVISLGMIVFLFIISLFYEEGGSYLGLFMFIILPVFLVIGLLMIPIGMWIKSRRDKKKKVETVKGWPKYDLNDKRTRNATMIFGVGTIFLLFLSAVGSYEAFHYSESVEFCGTICHTVMKPEYVAYQNSSHARVACVDCHVGSGADWYVKAKLSGLYQVYAVIADIYPKPIPTPIKNLRPARETCEECHWPEKFYARQLIMNKHYLPDEENTEWDITLQMKTGPAYSALGLQEGIHWHINPDIKVEYVATDDQRENIPWVKYTNKITGEEYIYTDTDTLLTSEQLNSLELREMDCMDCHNRPSHDYQTPVNFINNAITSGSIPKELPDVKYMAMEVLKANFLTTDSMMEYIEEEMYNYYELMYEDIFNDNRQLIDDAIEGIQTEFKKNVFPEMRVNWNVYPNHIGHLEFDGCFRCHNDRFSDGNGHTISMDCNLCHTIIAQGVPDTLQVGSIYNALEFVHPNDPNDAWKDDLCSECHRDLYME